MSSNSQTYVRDPDVTEAKEQMISNNNTAEKPAIANGGGSNDNFVIGPDYCWYPATEMKNNTPDTSRSSSSTSQSSVESFDQSMRLDYFVQNEYTHDEFWKFNDPINGFMKDTKFEDLFSDELKFKRISDVLFHTQWKQLSVQETMGLFGKQLWVCSKDSPDSVYRYLCGMKTFMADVNTMYLGDIKKDYALLGTLEPMPRLSDKNGRPLELHIDGDMQYLAKFVFGVANGEHKFCKSCLMMSEHRMLKSVDLWCCNKCLYRFMIGNKNETLEQKIERLKEYTNKFDKKIKYMLKYGHVVGGLRSQWQNTFEHRTLDVREFIWSLNRKRYEARVLQFYSKGEEKKIDINWRIEGFYC